jgi:hypothetical protein
MKPTAMSASVRAGGYTQLREAAGHHPILVPLAVAANVAEVQPATIRKWVERGIITRHPDGYDLTELLHWIDTRRPDASTSSATANTSRSAQPSARPNSACAACSCHPVPDSSL